MVNPDRIWDYCWNCGRPIYEKQVNKYCRGCENLLNNGVKEFMKQKQYYTSLLISGKCSDLEATVT